MSLINHKECEFYISKRQLDPALEYMCDSFHVKATGGIIMSIIRKMDSNETRQTLSGVEPGFGFINRGNRFKKEDC